MKIELPLTFEQSVWRKIRAIEGATQPDRGRLWAGPALQWALACIVLLLSIGLGQLQGSQSSSAEMYANTINATNEDIVL